MKILYFGTVCDLKKYDNLLVGCKRKPSVSTIVFESALLEGFRQNGADLEIHSFPMIPTYSHSHLLHFGRCREILPCGYTCQWLNTVNLPGIKQLTRSMDARAIMDRWGRENRGNGVILSYSIPPFLVKNILRCGEKYGLKTVAIVPDLLRDMYVNEADKGIQKILKKRYLAGALRLQDGYDGYVYLTEAMHEVVAPDKPYMVMEGIAGIPTISAQKTEKASPRAIMYAGMLHEKYGILNLVDAFERLPDKSIELWLFGDGTAGGAVRRRAEQDRRIRCFGTVDRDKVLEYERRATLLVNVRSPAETFTQYSFPSKTIEYMLSGTPLLTTRLPGIPKEYFQYTFSAADNGVEELTQGLGCAMACSPETLENMGNRAREYIVREKNARRQAARVIRFLEEV